MIVVETVGSFMLFTFLMIAILSLINIVTLQARIHGAATQAVETVSIYCYVLEVMGAADMVMDIRENARTVTDQSNEFKTELNSMVAGMQNFSPNDTIYHAGAAGDMATSWISDTANDPQKALSLIANYAIGEGLNYVFGESMRLLMGRYLSNGSMNGDEYLRSVNVVDGLSGLTFYDFSLFDFDDLTDNDSSFLTAEGDVKIVIRYSVKYVFGALPLPIKDIEITHVVITKAWLGGSGDGYWKKSSSEDG